jgi:exopolysaccharide biosynthesis polyprenyl glycosylphosphotransferase
MEDSSRLIYFLADCAAAFAALAITLNNPWWLIPLWVIIAATFFDPRYAAQPRHAFNITCLTASVIAVFALFVIGDIFVLYFIIACALISFAARGVCIVVLQSSSLRRRFFVIRDSDEGKSLPGLRSTSHVVVGAGAVGDVTVDQLAAQRVTDILIDARGEIDDHLLHTLLECRRRRMRIIRFTSFYEHLTGRVLLDHLDSNWLDQFLASDSKWMRLYARAMDIVSGGVGLIFFAAIFPAVAAAIWLESGSPVLHRQTRMGRDGRLFKLIKLRTMYQDAEQDGQVRWADINDPRVTRVGRFLRRTRLDEVPQFWNVLADEMSLIGPRPERPEIISMLESRLPFYRLRLAVKPGLTGWAQINYPYAATVDDSARKLEYDLFYIKHRSLWLDVLIVWHTLKTIIQMSGM